MELITSIYTCTYMSHFKTQTIYCSVKKEGCMVDHSTSDILMRKTRRVNTALISNTTII